MYFKLYLSKKSPLFLTSTPYYIADNNCITIKSEDNVDNYLMIRPSGLIIIKHKESAV